MLHESTHGLVTTLAGSVPDLDDQHPFIPLSEPRRQVSRGILQTDSKAIMLGYEPERNQRLCRDMT